MLKGIGSDIKEWFLETARVMRREFSLIFGDIGVMLFFLALPLAYPIVYALIYNPEITKEIPVAVVDSSRSPESRQFVRHVDATQAIKICGYAANMSEARRWWDEEKCIGILEIPADYAEKIGRGEQGLIQFYSNVSLLLRYRSFLSALTEVQQATDTELRQITINSLGTLGDMAMSGEAAGTEAYFLGDTQQGFASFIMPGIVVLILQQSILLGICMLGGTSCDRKRRFGGIDPLSIQASPSAIVIGKTLTVVTIYLPLTIYILHYVPWFFSFPHLGNIADYILFIFPMLLATAMLGQTLQIFVSERESSFIVIVFTSVLFLFLSGITWPRYAMSDFWRWLGNLVPATWGMEGFIRINNNGATLAQQHNNYLWLWGLTLAYFATAYLVTRYRTRRGA